jgi:uncharacterized FlaG/YvyC family protein
MSSENRINSDLKIAGLVTLGRPDRRESGAPDGNRQAEVPTSLGPNTKLSDSLTLEIKDSLAALNQILGSSDKELSINVDSVTGAAIFRIIDTTTGEVVLQVPSRLTADISASLITRRGVLLESNQ